MSLELATSLTTRSSERRGSSLVFRLAFWPAVAELECVRRCYAHYAIEAMRFPLRLIHDSTPKSYSPVEQGQLSACLLSAPGVESATEPERHPRGGYSVVVQYAGDSPDALAAHLLSCGYRAVL